MIWRLFYNSLLVPLGWLGFQVYGLFNPKARRGIRGRKGLFTGLEARMRTLQTGGGDRTRRVWFHVSSMGEFEQARAVISLLREKHPGVGIIVSFFSPSGYEHSLASRDADVITYIPFDSRSNAGRFLEIVRPTAAVVMRYDLWPNHVWRMRATGVPVFLASATLKDSRLRRLPVIRSFYRSLYDALHSILTVSDEDASRFRGFGLVRARLDTVGDTRYDQVARRCEESKKKTLLPPRFLDGKTVFVVGSCWEEDEEIIVPALADFSQRHPALLTVLVPHEPTVEHLGQLEDRLEGKVSSIRFSQLLSYSGERAVIVDSVGILVSLYQYADIVFVGGGFGSGIHNVLEPAVYGVPVIVGPRCENSREAGELKGRGALRVVGDVAGFREEFGKLIGDAELRKRMGATALSFVSEKRGASERILSHLEKVL